MFRLTVAIMGNTQEIEAALRRLCPFFLSGGQTIENLKRLSGGASQETWAFDAVSPSGQREELILRRAPSGQDGSRSSAAIGLAKEAALIEAAARAGIPVPKVTYVCRETDELGEAFIMGRLSGETIAPKILRDPKFAGARPLLARQCGKALAGVHALKTEQLPDLALSDGLDQIDQYEDIYRSFDLPKPVFELAMAWLRAHTPKRRSNVLVHGDFRLGNLMVDGGGLVGVLDWELAHFGDPREDLAWICINSWRFGNPGNRVGGFGGLDDLLAGYSEAGGVVIDPAEIDWWEMLGSLKWGIMCLIMYEAFRSGADPSVERATIGRRVSEAEIDILNVLERV
ncbi:MAG: phosphotransferase family protein [Pseudomonadota bacterium]